MNKKAGYKLKKINKYFLYSLPFLFFLGSISHFVYDITGKMPLIGIFFPVNESIYEHTKLAIVPLLLFYLYGIKFKPDKKKWLFSFLISLFATIILMPMLYYFYTGAFGFTFLIIDILIYFVSITCGQWLAKHIYNKCNFSLNSKVIIILLTTYFVLNIIFTIDPPHLPLFLDPVNHTYGLGKEFDIKK